jgi:hypothetical protein
MTTYEFILERYARIIAGQSTQSIKEAENELAKMEPNFTFVADNVAIICELSNSSKNKVT